jgi:hypothetical protein
VDQNNLEAISEIHGGSFAGTVLGWLNWQRNDNKKAAGMFIDENC